MELIEQSHEILEAPEDVLKMIETAGRTCYKSEKRITDTSSTKFVTMLRDHNHSAMIEFGDITVKFITNRGVTHELVRHRMCSFAQESTRYVLYNNGMQFICPSWLPLEMCGEYTAFESQPLDIPDILGVSADDMFIHSLQMAEWTYGELIKKGWRAEQAREVLPNALKTEIVVKTNIREWRHILNLRCSAKAHPQIRSLMIPLLHTFKKMIPVVFDDILYY